MALKWTVEFTVADCWVADGFDLTDERAHAILSNDLCYAHSTELAAKVIDSPPKEIINDLQSGKIDCLDIGEVVDENR